MTDPLHPKADGPQMPEPIDNGGPAFPLIAENQENGEHLGTGRQQPPATGTASVSRTAEGANGL
jgi:hypothetical protein